MTLTMATQKQLDLIREMSVDKKMDPTDIADYFGRTTDLNEKGRLTVAQIAWDLSQGKDVQPDGTDLGQFIEV